MTLQQILEDLKPLLAKYKPFRIYSDDTDYYIGVTWGRWGDEPYIVIQDDSIKFGWFCGCPTCGFESQEFEQEFKIEKWEKNFPPKWEEIMDDWFLLEEDGK